MNPVASEDFRHLEIVSHKHQLPPLAYHYAALEPFIDSRTLKLHHDVHHWAYVEKLNALLEKLPDLRDRSAPWLLGNLDQVPERIRQVVRHNAGGHVNHSLFWQSMTPDAAGGPNGPLHDAITRDFGSVAEFKLRFEAAGAGVPGSGWVWLMAPAENGGRLEVITTAGQDHPSPGQGTPLLLNDVWEHAYYLHYESRRGEYLKAWWSVADWKAAGRRFNTADHAAGGRGEVQGDLFLAA